LWWYGQTWATHQASNDSREKGDDHFITFSCYRREPYLATAGSKNIFLDSLELTRKRHNFEVLGFVVMPEHVHLLISESLDEPDYETPLELHAPQPGHPRPCRKTRGLVLVQFPSLSSGRTRPGPDIPALTNGSRLRAIAHLIDDKTVAKMGHPTLVMSAGVKIGHRTPRERRFAAE
jgi:hypothetical protein